MKNAADDQVCSGTDSCFFVIVVPSERFMHMSQRIERTPGDERAPNRQRGGGPVLGPKCGRNAGSADSPDASAGIGIWIVGAGGRSSPTGAPIGLKIRSGELVKNRVTLRLRKKGFSNYVYWTYIATKERSAGTRVADDPKLLAFVPISLTDGLAGSLGGCARFRGRRVSDPPPRRDAQRPAPRLPNSQTRPVRR